MSRTGRPRKSVDLKVLSGTFRPDREPVNVKPGEAVKLDMPTHLSPVAKKEWDRITMELNALGILSPVDRVPLAMYCDAYARWVSATGILQRRGNTFKTKSGFIRTRPEVKLRDEALVQMQSLLEDIQKRVAKLPPAPKKTVSRRERLLAGDGA